MEINTYKIILLSILMCFTACGKANQHSDAEAPQLLSSIPSDGQTNVAATTRNIVLNYDQTISLVSPHNILLNGILVNQPEISGKKLEISVSLRKNTSYSLLIPAGKIKGESGMTAGQAEITFQTEKENEVPGEGGLVTPNSSPEARKVFHFLQENFGEKIISGTMANVSWNINEAEWVKKHTGKYPALNCFDYIHLFASPASWINYEEISVIEDWWEANGLVSTMWHWNVPQSQGSATDKFAFYTKETTFDITKALQEGTWENTVIMADLNKIADNLLLLKEKNIPVIWRPLHEAAGGWFWWGAKGADACKALWKLMFDTFQSKGLNNLIWVWTAEPNDDEWYPGDEYVDIIGRDIYNKTANNQLEDEYKSLKERYPDKIIALSECGNVASISGQWSAGAKWSWFMPWYDYERTNTVNSGNFNETNHGHASVSYWNDAFSNENVLTRENMPSLK